MLETLSDQLPVSLTTQAVLLGVTVGLLTYTLLKKKYKHPPGPRPLPLLGNIRDMNDASEPLMKKLISWKKEYGPVISVFFGPVRCVTLNSATVVNEAYVQKAADFAGRFQIYSMNKLSDGCKNIIFADMSPAWKMQRKIALQGLRQYLSGSKLEENLLESSLKVLDEIKSQNGKPFPLLRYISLLTFNLLNGVCFSKCYDIDDEDFLKKVEDFERFNTEFGVGFWEDIFPPLRKFPTAKFRRLCKVLEDFRDFVSEEYKKHEMQSEDELDDFTSYLIKARKQAIIEDPSVENLITETHILHTVSDIFLAGTDTTRLTITWTILLLIKYPEKQKKVQEEVDKVIDVNQCPTVQDRARLPYTEAVLHESMRIIPVVPMGLPHKTLCDTTIGDYDVPKGTLVMANHYALHHDPDWWKDPEVFKPERFLDEDGKLAPKTLSWLPFSSGRRNCLGETIARPEMHLILAILLRNMTFSCPAVEKLELFKQTGTFAFVPPPVDVIATPRQ